MHHNVPDRLRVGERLTTFNQDETIVKDPAASDELVKVFEFQGKRSGACSA
jgi:hypothetical protein